MRRTVKQNQFNPLIRVTPSALLLVVCVAGCQTFGGSAGEQRFFPPLPFVSSGDADSDDESTEVASQVGGAKRKPGTNRFGSSHLVGYVTGQSEDLPRAKELYLEADAIFREAVRAPDEQRTKMFEQSAKLFHKATKEAPGSAIHQDALFMKGEAYFFADDLNNARDAFEILQKEFPRNRHSDRAAARLFAISKYWIDLDKSGSESWYTLNFFDDKRPMRDSASHAIRVLDQIRYDDPTGKLADDATMAAAAEYIRRGDYERADEFLADLRETFSDSDHLFLAHLLGIRCKLEVYAGPLYSERMLDEADVLVKQTRRRFPDKLKDKKYADMVARAAAEIDYHKAAKLSYRADIREKQREYASARDLYRMLLRDHPQAPQAEQARERLAQIEELPGSPDKPLAFMTKLFPSAKQSPPLVTVESLRSTEGDAGESEPPPNESFFR
ncbi:tetratricopeptide repeat protein [Roseiconus lacunae]|uniref:Tetratricopeptide repeat protein n=1 Tax=Roseiconus lacunae TaxID=2605694 RepID=A0ABT7PQ31_9BACT|nr:tetratricopeptide repeat protein [Roseiconus lacunae]MCD0461902.1 tetratricopeptide repeat protein [Roseiconus lacunae]MDM4018613.1 tetratricopeptide repeat protein [Roseiconus lacunae]WRQ52667.1 tetratricopeptide repeat protein [Stieleria sp. HD01]